MIGLACLRAFLGVSLLVICTPGQDTALTIRNTLLGRRRAGIATAFGVAGGQAIWTLATSAGLAVVLAASGPLFLGDPARGRRVPHLPRGAFARGRASPGVRTGDLPPPGGITAVASLRASLQGVLSNLSNAKMVAFFISLLPQFAGPHPSFVLLLALGSRTSACSRWRWLVAYAFAVERLSGWLRRGAVRRVIDGLLGAVLIGLGLRVTAQALAR